MEGKFCIVTLCGCLGVSVFGHCEQQLMNIFLLASILSFLLSFSSFLSIMLPFFHAYFPSFILFLVMTLSAFIISIPLLLSRDICASNAECETGIRLACHQNKCDQWVFPFSDSLPSFPLPSPPFPSLLLPPYFFSFPSFPSPFLSLWTFSPPLFFSLCSFWSQKIASPCVLFKIYDKIVFTQEVLLVPSEGKKNDSSSMLKDDRVHLLWSY